MTKFAPLKQRMEAMTTLSETGCMEWNSSLNKLGYGVVSFQKGPGPKNRTSTTAHRKYWELVNGPIPDGMQVNHRCDNRRCINPEHMFLGDQVANIRDMMQKGRDNFQGKGAYLKRKAHRQLATQPLQEHHRPHADQIPPDEQQHAL